MCASHAQLLRSEQSSLPHSYERGRISVIIAQSNHEHYNDGNTMNLNCF